MYAIYNFLVTLSPCGFIAATYVLLGRLARSVDGDRHLLVPPQKITKIFVASDVITFLAQVRCRDLSYVGCETLTLSAGRRWWYICICGVRPFKGKPRFQSESSSRSSTSSAYRVLTIAQIFLVGLILQLLSFIFFTLVYVRFIYRVREYEPAMWHRDGNLSWFNDWRALAGALAVSCVGIIVRFVVSTPQTELTSFLL